jgi:uncharacterized membrane protein
MKSAASVAEHPIHPMLIPYPFAFLSGAAAFDVAAAARGNVRLADTAQHLRSAGIVMALAAAVPGLIDYLYAVPAGRSRQIATVHMLSNLGGVGLFAAAARGRREGRPSARTIGLEILGTTLLSLGGWLGGSLVYHHQVGVSPEAPRIAAEAREPSAPPARKQA